MLDNKLRYARIHLHLASYSLDILMHTLKYYSDFQTYTPINSALELLPTT